MLKNTKKYFIFLVSALLVMSNFSFATQQVLCLMNMSGDEVCSCVNTENTDFINVISFTSDGSACCSHKTLELNNTNNLQTTGTELPKDISNFPPAIVNLGIVQLYNSPDAVSFSSLNGHVPRTEIPIFISSLLI